MGPVTSVKLAVEPPPRAFGEAHAPRATARGWDFLGSCPAPLRMRMRDELADLLRERQFRHAEKLKCCMPMGHGGRTPFERLRHIRDLDDFPKLLASSEHGNAFNRAFHARHVETGAFVAPQPAGFSAPFAEAGLIDPRGWIGVYAVVSVVDPTGSGKKPVARRHRMSGAGRHPLRAAHPHRRLSPRPRTSMGGERQAGGAAIAEHEFRRRSHRRRFHRNARRMPRGGRAGTGGGRSHRLRQPACG